MAAHKKVIFLGAYLLSSCGIVAAIGIWGTTAVQQKEFQLARREAPAIALLLQIDRDLYQAQLGLERATVASGSAEASAGLKFFTENIGESAQRFNLYRTLATNEQKEVQAIRGYDTDRIEWLSAADQLRRTAEKVGYGSARITSAIGASDIIAMTEQSRTRFNRMREHVNYIVDEIYQPAIEASGDRAERSARLTYIKLLSSVIVALIAGVWLTRNMARALRVQHQTAEWSTAEREAQNRRQTFESRLSRGLEMAQDESATLKLIEEAIVLAAPNVKAEILLADSSRAHVHQAATTDHTSPHRHCAVAKPSDCPAVRRGHRLSFESSTNFDACPHLKNRPGGNCSAVCIPLSIMGQTVGVLHSMAVDGQLPADEEIQGLELIASKSGERIGLLRAFRRTEAQASCDPLTGLMNRRSLEEKVHALTLEQIPFAVAYGDLDHFKNLNDTHGHETGDKALRTFAQVLKTSVRPGDLPARWGGEEFVLVLPRASSDEAVAALDRVRKALGKTLETAGMPVFTVSFGVAQTSEGALFVDVLAGADEALLRAKREGRNRTITLSNCVPVIERPLEVDTREKGDGFIAEAA